MSQGGKSKLKQKRELRDERDKCMKNFINELTKLAQAAVSKNKSDEDFRERFDQYNIAKRDAPDEIVNMAGPPLWDYREDIMQGNVAKFLNSDFKEDIVKYADHIPDADFIEEDQILIEKVKRSWHLFTNAEQSVMLKRVQKLVSLYGKYLFINKQLEELNSRT